MYSRGVRFTWFDCKTSEFVLETILLKLCLLCHYEVEIVYMVVAVV